jgi:hypothetical protein
VLHSGEANLNLSCYVSILVLIRLLKGGLCVVEIDVVGILSSRNSRCLEISDYLLNALNAELGFEATVVVSILSY